MKKTALFGYALGLVIGLFIIFVLPVDQDWHEPGPANSGHENLDCADCHVDAAGTLRQQIQANVGYWLGLRKSGAVFGHYDVSNDNCLACHDRPNDRHPVYRFLEPRFLEARQAISPQRCESCHLEHQGRRVTIDATFCVYCHTDLDLADDPIDVPHIELVAQENWTSCMGCHDFHGNHIMEVPTRLADQMDPQSILDYFLDAPSPYSDTRLYEAKESLDD